MTRRVWLRLVAAAIALLAASVSPSEARFVPAMCWTASPAEVDTYQLHIRTGGNEPVWPSPIKFDVLADGLQPCVNGQIGVPLAALDASWDVTIPRRATVLMFDKTGKLSAFHTEAGLSRMEVP